MALGLLYGSPSILLGLFCISSARYIRNNSNGQELLGPILKAKLGPYLKERGERGNTADAYSHL